MAYIPIECKVVYLTDAAVKIDVGDGEDHWVPLSLCEEPPEIGDAEILVQEWFAKKEGLE